MALPDNGRLACFVVMAFVTTTAMIASPASAQSDQEQVPPAVSGTPTATPQLRNTLENCMGYWDAGTHMSKAEWQAACRRTVNGTKMDVEALDTSVRNNTATGKARKARGRAKGSRR